MTEPTEKLLSQSEREAFEAFARDMLAQQPVDTSVADRLAQARAHALKQVERPAPRWPAWAAAACLIVGIGAVGHHHWQAKTAPADWALVAELEDADVDVELIEDLEFYQWLSEIELES